jgi:hypothetical protein
MEAHMHLVNLFKHPVTAVVAVLAIVAWIILSLAAHHPLALP